MKKVALLVALMLLAMSAVASAGGLPGGVTIQECVGTPNNPCQ